MIDNTPIKPGDIVLVKATVTEVRDDDPHDPIVVVWFNGQAHETTVMNIESKKKTTGYRNVGQPRIPGITEKASHPRRSYIGIDSPVSDWSPEDEDD